MTVREWSAGWKGRKRWNGWKACAVLALVAAGATASIHAEEQRRSERLEISPGIKSTQTDLIEAAALKTVRFYLRQNREEGTFEKLKKLRLASAFDAELGLDKEGVAKVVSLLEREADVKIPLAPDAELATVKDLADAFARGLAVKEKKASKESTK